MNISELFLLNRFLKSQLKICRFLNLRAIKWMHSQTFEHPFVVVKRWSNAMSSDGKSMLPPIHASCAKATAMW
jgi:hypothetical protein